MSEADGPSGAIRHVAIVGAGFSGTLQAINLLRHDGPRVTLIERGGSFGRGVAYSTPSPDHLLNVRAANMSALPDEPDHFVRWLERRGGGAAQSFARRRDYGRYLSELLEAAAATWPGRLELLRADVTGVDATVDAAVLHLAGGRRVDADAAVLALGNLPPHDPAGVDGALLSPDVYASDPWAGDFTEGLGEQDRVLVLGTGLTMIDVVLTLEGAGFGGTILALSRRGLVPRAHGHGAMGGAGLDERPGGPLSALVRTVRERAAEIGWRAAIDELRPFTQAIWLSAEPAEQQRFLRHLRAWWDVHRHRIAPAIAARIGTLQDDGRLIAAAGKVLEVAPAGEGAEVTWRRRGEDAVQRLPVRRLINCTGPQGDLLRTNEPLLRGLLDAGRIRPDRHRLGIDVNAQAETIDASGRANPRLLALGPMTRGTFWEIVAVPDIRVQAWSVARRLSNAHWVGGEGL